MTGTVIRTEEVWNNVSSGGNSPHDVGTRPVEWPRNSQWPIIPVWPRRDVRKLCWRFQHSDPMPLALPNNARLTGSNFKKCQRFCITAPYRISLMSQFYYLPKGGLYRTNAYSLPSTLQTGDKDAFVTLPGQFAARLHRH